MVAITLPDGQARQYSDAVTGLEIAESIGAGLAKAAVAIRVNGNPKDLTATVPADARIEIITRDSEEGLEILRHDAAHVLAEAVKELYPETQVTIGPAIENGFYYDFYREKSFTPEDLEKIEAHMRTIVDRDEPIVRDEWTRTQALDYYRKKGETFKAKVIEELITDDVITIYQQGSFVDPCRGPHLTSTGRLGKSFKLMKLAGAYWRGDSKNPMLQRIYGTAWANDKQLKGYLTMLEEAEKRDHRVLGREMDLFHLQEEAPGCVFWHPKGWRLNQTLRTFIRKRLKKAGYREVNTPLMVSRTLWEKSGHWEKFQEDMFTVATEDDRQYAIKPMNCPCHVEIFKQGIKSYRDLPIRMAEFGNCHRNESSGALHGLTRVRSMVQDDAHIFCREDQITEETKAFCQLLQSSYKALGFESIVVRFSDRPEKRAGSDEVWDKAEKALKDATESAGIETVLNPGEGAFYGPKLEFCLKDAIGRQWQCGTWQVDFVLPERLGAEYVGEDGDRHRPVMLHRAVFGSLERFIAILIEHHAGRFPLWLAPTQVAVATITEEQNDYAQEVFKKLQNAGLEAHLDLKNEKITAKIRRLSHQKIPVILVVGKREAEEKTVAIRRLGGRDQEILELETALGKLEEEAQPPW